MDKKKKLNEELFTAIRQKKSLKKIKELLKAGADPNYCPRYEDGVGMYGGKTFLIEICRSYHDYPDRLYLIIELIRAGADINLGDNEKNTPLHHAAQAGDLHLCLSLVANGAKSLENGYGDQPCDVVDYDNVLRVAMKDFLN